MQRSLAIFSLLLLCYCQPSRETEQQTASPLLQKSIDYHDPEGNWQQFKARLYLSSTDTLGKESPFQVEIDNTTGYFSHISQQDGKEIVKGISAGGKAFFQIDGKEDFSEEEREKYKLTAESAEGTRNFYLHLYGLPMKLTDAGTQVSDSVYTQRFHGKDYQVMPVSYDPAVGNDQWLFFLNPNTAAMEAYSFHWGDPEGGEYILLEDELTVEGIKIPRVRKWYFTKGDQYLGTDTLLKAEKLAEHRK